MNVIRKIALRGMAENRKRTTVTIIGVVLATALITAVANMAECFRASMIAYEKAESGDYHYSFQGVERQNLKYFEENQNIRSLGYEYELGYAPLEGSQNPDKPYVFIKAMDEASLQGVCAKLREGRFPENGSELLISAHIRSNGLVDWKVGDVVTLNLGHRDGGDSHSPGQWDPYREEAEVFVGEETRTYTIVGIMERPGYEIETRMAPGYTVVTHMELADAAEKYNLYATYTRRGLQNRDQVTAGLLGVPMNLYYHYSSGAGKFNSAEHDQLTAVADGFSCNIWLIKWELLLFGDATKTVLYGMAAVAVCIIIAASVFCIRNSFIISLTEKTRFYGMFASVGATRRQRKQLVYTEGLLVGSIGVPLGILCGAFATFVVVKITGGMVKDALEIALVYKLSFPAMILGALLSAVTVRFSAGRAARRAGKLSPIRAIRGNDDTKISPRELACPGLVKRLFGIGGEIAYKNLRRARSKYRTTVVSIVVSVAIFIGMSKFVELGFLMARVSYEDISYQISVNFFNERDIYGKAKSIAGMEGVTYAEICRQGRQLRVPGEEVPYDSLYYDTMFVELGGNPAGDFRIELYSIGEDAYREYCKKVGVDYGKAKDKAILIGNFKTQITDERGRSRQVTGDIFDYRAGDVIRGTMAVPVKSEATGESGTEEREVAFEIAACTDTRPLRLWNSWNVGALIVSDEWMDAHADLCYDQVSLYIQCEDPDALEEQIRRECSSVLNLSIHNHWREYRAERSLYLVIAIFLYGFLVVVALIGVTNVFNTVTANMELRTREFAMLRSVGMTGREFRRMIQLESLFYGAKSLLIGIPAGTLLAYAFHRVLMRGIVMKFSLPITGILISTAAVFALVYGIMRYSMGKIRRKNIMESVRNENI